MPRSKHSHQKRKGTAPPAPKDGFALRGRIWVDGPEGTFIGYGRVVLMERIREHGSITKAAKSMDMSYRRAWLLIDSMNRQAREPFVVTSTGGKNGGGTKVTPAGEKAITHFWKAYEALGRFLAGEGRRFE